MLVLSKLVARDATDNGNDDSLLGHIGDSLTAAITEYPMHLAVGLFLLIIFTLGRKGISKGWKSTLKKFRNLRTRRERRHNGNDLEMAQPEPQNNNAARMIELPLNPSTTAAVLTTSGIANANDNDGDIANCRHSRHTTAPAAAVCCSHASRPCSCSPPAYCPPRHNQDNDHRDREDRDRQDGDGDIGLFQLQFDPVSLALEIM